MSRINNKNMRVDAQKNNDEINRRENFKATIFAYTQRAAQCEKMRAQF